MASELDQAGNPQNQGFEPLSTVSALPPVFHDVFPFRYFNSIQADCFQCLYHSRDSAVVRGSFPSTPGLAPRGWRPPTFHHSHTFLFGDYMAGG